MSHDFTVFQYTQIYIYFLIQVNKLLINNLNSLMIFLIFKNNFEFKKTDLINYRLNKNIQEYYICNLVLNVYMNENLDPITC